MSADVARIPTATAPVASWREAVERLVGWRQGDHMTLIGPTDCGKTTFASKVLSRRRRVVVIATKPRDDSFDHFGYRRVTSWPPPPDVHRVILQPAQAGLGEHDNARDKVLGCLEHVWRAGGWCVYFDEVRYVTNTLGLKSQVEDLLMQGRALGITVVCATQRPAWVPQEAFSQASWLVLWQTNELRDVRRLREMVAGADEVAEHAPDLDAHQFLLADLRSGELIRSTVEV